jgi:hypothetical protein
MKLVLTILAFATLVPAESLHYSINWQSGLSLGEAVLSSTPTGDGTASGWAFELMLDASVPGFMIRDEYSSTADGQLCSAEMKKTTSRGSRKSEEKLTFDQSARTVKREILDGGPTGTASMPVCGRDALTFLQFVRQELAQGRLAPQQPVVLGAKYDIHMVYIGAEAIKVADQRRDADKVRVSIKGPKADHTVELFFARDAARTPLMARLPLALGVFTVELLP